MRKAIPAEHEFGRIVQKLAKPLSCRERPVELAQRQDREAVLGDGKGMLPFR